MSRIIVLSFLVCSLFFIESFGNDKPKSKPASVPLSNSMCTGSTITLNTIHIDEVFLDDFDVVNGSQQTLILEILEPGLGSFVPRGEIDLEITNPTDLEGKITVTETQIIITLTESGTPFNQDQLNYLVIDGVQFTSTTAGIAHIIVSTAGNLVTQSFPPTTTQVTDVTVNDPATPSFLSGPPTTCANAVNVQYVTETGVTDFVWNITGHVGVSNGGGPGDHFIDINWGPAGPGSVSVSYTDANECATTTTTQPVIINGPPTLTGETTVCRNSTHTYNAQPGAGTYNWSSTGGNPVAGGGSGDDFITLEWFSTEGPSVSVEYTTVDGCYGTPSLGVSYEEPTGVTNGSSNICSGSVVGFDIQNHYSSDSGVGNPDFEWTAIDNPNVTGESISSQPGGTLNDMLVNTTTSVESIVYTITPTSTNLGCTGSSFTIEVFVNPIPQGTNATTSLCSGDNLNFQLLTTNGVTADSFEFIAADNPNVSGEPTTGSSGYYLTETLTSSSAVPEEVIYVVTPRSGPAGLCAGSTYDVTVTVKPSPAITGPSTLCGPQQATFNAPAGHGADYSWSYSGDLSYVSGGDEFDFLTLNILSSEGASVSVTIGGCNSNTITVSVVSDSPEGPAEVTPLTICSNEALSYDLQSAIINSEIGTFTWVAAENTAITGESTSPDNTAFITDDLTNITTLTEVVSYTVTPANDCGAGANFTIDVTVRPKPVGINGAKTLCKAEAVDFDLTPQITNGVVSTFSWQAEANEDILGESYFAPVISSSITDMLTTKNGASTVKYKITPSSPLGCSGTQFDVDVLVDFLPFFTLKEEDVCSNSMLSTTLETAFSNIVVNNKGLTLAGGTDSNGSGKNPSELMDDEWLNTGLDSVVVIYHVTPIGTNGCTGEPYQVAAHINPKPILNTPAPSTCTNKNLAITLETDAASVAAATFDISSITASGALNPGAGNATIAAGYLSNGILGDVWTNTSIVNETVTYVIVPVSDQSCTGDPASVVATIKPAPTVTPTNNAPLISNGGATNITLTSNIPGSSFLYNAVKPVQIVGGETGGGPVIAQILTNTGTIRQSVFYMITATFNGCQGAQQSVAVEVNGNPTISTADSVALVSLYNATNGAGWSEQSNWLTGAADTWLGIGVTSERVTSITLPENNLTGTLPTAMYTLSELINLILNDNNISGTLSSQVSNLTKLKVLNLGGNDMTGTVPTEIYSLTGFTNLSLNHNQFTGSTSSLIGGLVNLEVLRFNNLPMTGSIPAEVFTLNGLKTLGLSGKLNGPIPASIGAMTGLKRLLCDDCGITSLPSQISTLTNLVAISLPNNKLPSLPDVSGLTLDSLIVTKNKLGFDAIEPNLGIPNFSFNPQDSVGTKIVTTIQTGTPYTVTSVVGGSVNQYQWRKNGSPLGGATSANYNIASTAFQDEGSYTVEVTSTAVPGLTLISLATRLKVSSLKRDSLSLVQLYEKTKGSLWTNKSGWMTGKLSTWTGVTINSNRVTAINLSNNNLDGKVPAAICDMLSLSTVNFATNKLTQLPNLTPLTQLTTVNVSANKLGFGSLEPNVSILNKINYANQADLGTVRQDSVESGSLVKVKAITDGVSNSYQWKKNGLALTGATDSTFTIQSIGRTNMGQYVCEITNPTVPGLTLKSAAQTVLASTDLSGKLFIEANVPATKGQITLFRVTNANGYDTIKVIQVKNDGTFQFKKVVLDNYQILGYADIGTYDRALPTYYKKTILWEEADVLSVDAPLVGLNIVSELKPGPPSGKGIISGIVEEDDGTGNGRTKKPARVSSAGVSARRVENTGRGKEEKLTLVAYVFTNQNGEFEITNLPVGQYRLNIQYPGYPMDENSFVTVPIGNALQAEVRVEAFVEAGKITVRQLIITGIMSKEGYKADVYPNPSSDFIEVTFGSVSAYREVGMFDTMGKKISSAGASDTHVSLDIRSLPKGNYLLNITEKGHPVKSLHVIIE